MTLRRWEGVASYVEQSRPHGPYGGAYGDKSRGRNWDDGLTWTEACGFGLTGQPALTERATRLVDGIESAGMVDMLAARYVPSVAGARVDVPAYLAGSPTCMRRRVKVDRPVRTVAIYVSVTSSAGISATQLLERGCAILGLLETLQACQIQPDLYVFNEVDGDHGAGGTGDCFHVIHIESRPLDLSTASFAIAHPAWARQVMYGLARHIDMFTGGWPKSRESSQARAGGTYDAFLRRTFDMSPTDVLIHAPYGNDIARAGGVKPWIERHMSQILKGEVAA